MKVYCINLDSRPDRLEHVTNEFGRQSMVFERISAVDGNDPSIAAAARTLTPMWPDYRISSNMFACLQSHRKTWQRLLDSRAQHAMIFEDDMLLSKGIAAYLDDGWVPEDADVVKLETFGTRTHIDRIATATVAGRRIRRLRSTHIGAGAYLLTAAAAQRLLIETKTRVAPPDEVIFNDTLPLFHDLTVYQIFPAPAIQGTRNVGSMAAANGAADWVKTSIEQPIEMGPDYVRPKRETIPGRLWRRTRAELRARLKGTEYVVVPHG